MGYLVYLKATIQSSNRVYENRFFFVVVFLLLFFFFFLFDQQSFRYKGSGVPGLNQYLARSNVLAQGHNAVALMRLEPAAPRSRVYH